MLKLFSIYFVENTSRLVLVADASSGICVLDIPVGGSVSHNKLLGCKVKMEIEKIPFRNRHIIFNKVP